MCRRNSGRVVSGRPGRSRTTHGTTLKTKRRLRKPIREFRISTKNPLPKWRDAVGFALLPSRTTQGSRFARIDASMELYVIAGPNGAGKTTFAHEFLPKY